MAYSTVWSESDPARYDAKTSPVSPIQTHTHNQNQDTYILSQSINPAYCTSLLQAPTSSNPDARQQTYHTTPKPKPTPTPKSEPDYPPHYPPVPPTVPHTYYLQRTNYSNKVSR